MRRQKCFCKTSSSRGVNPTPPLRRCDVSVKQIFRTWMKTLLHCGFVLTQVNQMTYEPMHSAQAQSGRVTEKISFGFVGHHCRDITRSEDNNKNRLELFSRLFEESPAWFCSHLGPLPSLYLVFTILLISVDCFFAFFGLFSSDFGFLYNRSIPNLLLFLHYFLSVGQWAPFSQVSPWLKP